MNCVNNPDDCDPGLACNPVTNTCTACSSLCHMEVDCCWLCKGTKALIDKGWTCENYPDVEVATRVNRRHRIRNGRQRNPSRKTRRNRRRDRRSLRDLTWTDDQTMPEQIAMMDKDGIINYEPRTSFGKLPEAHSGSAKEGQQSGFAQVSMMVNPGVLILVAVALILMSLMVQAAFLWQRKRGSHSQKQKNSESGVENNLSSAKAAYVPYASLTPAQVGAEFEFTVTEQTPQEAMSHVTKQFEIVPIHSDIKKHCYQPM